MRLDRTAGPGIDPTGLLCGLLEHYSPTGSEAEAVGFLVEAMRGFGYSARIDAAGNAIGTAGSGPREILLLGHIDTVPGRIAVRQADGCVFGRGAVDAKGPLAAFTCAGALARISPAWRVTVIGAVGEEGSSDGAKYLRQNHPAPEMVLIGEPSGWDHITLGYKGSLWLDFSVSRPAAHPAGKYMSACEGALTFWNNLRVLLDARNLDQSLVFNQVTPSLQGMHSEQDGFTENAVLHVNLRLPPGTGLAEARRLVEQAAEPIAALVGGQSHLELAEDGFAPAYRAEKNTVLVRSLLSGIRKAGGKPGFTLKTGTADLNLVAPAWGCPAAAYGPGDSALDHTPAEHIRIDEYRTGIEVLVHAIEKIQGIVED